MGRRGPPPKSPEQRRQQGTDKKWRPPHQANAVAMPVGSPVCPEGLPDDAKEVWDWVVPELLAIGTLAKVDGGILEGYCRMMARARALEGEAASVDGQTDADVGARRWAAAEVRKLWPVVEKFATDLGLHYAARNRVTLPKPRETKDPAEKFLFGQLEALPGGKP